MKKLFSGVCTALVTPFKNGKIDYISFQKIIESQIEAGIGALLFIGTTGEACTLTLSEKQEVIRFALSYVNGHLPLIFGIGGNNPSDIISLGKFVKFTAGKTKNVGVMVSAPYYNKCTQNGAVIFFHEIANAVKLPMIVYNVPGRTVINLEAQTMADITQNKYIAGIKEASGNIEQIASIVSLCPKTAIYSGDDSLSLPCYAIGCAGIISVASNVIPRDICTVWKNRKNRIAQTTYIKHLSIYKALFCEVNPIPIKFAMSHIGYCKNEVRLPLTELSSVNRELITSLLKN